MKRFATLLLPVLVLAGCTKLPSRKPTGQPTVVSLNPCSDALLADIAPGQLLAVSHYSHDPAASSMPRSQAMRFPDTNGTVEEVLALNPDVVVTDRFTAPATRAALTRLGIRVVTLGLAANVAQSEAQIRRLATLTGHERRGAALIARIQAALARTTWTGAKIPALLWQQGGMVQGSDTLAAQLLAHTGFANQARLRGLGQGAYLPLEQVLADPPAVIIAAGAGRMLHHPVLRDLRNTRVVHIDPRLLYCGGPTIPRLLDRLAQIRRSLA